jgi:hypothetical protein
MAPPLFCPLSSWDLADGRSLEVLLSIRRRRRRTTWDAEMGDGGATSPEVRSLQRAPAETLVTASGRVAARTLHLLATDAELAHLHAPRAPVINLHQIAALATSFCRRACD